MARVFHRPDALLPPPEESIAAWVERCMVLPRGVSGRPGPVDLDLTPYLRGPLDAAGDSSVREIVLCTSSQVAKTTFLMAVSLHTLAVDPAAQLYVMPTEDDAKELNIERYQPIIEASPELSKLRTGRQGEFTRDAVRLSGVATSFRGSNSPSGLASKGAKVLIADEIDKWPMWTGKEAGPLDLLGERAKTFDDSKFLKASTPTTPHGLIWNELLESTNERYHVPCPHCGGYQVLFMGDKEPGTPGIKWPLEERDPNRIAYDNLAWYECAHCQGRIVDAHKPSMLRDGLWVPECQKLIDGKLVGRAPPRGKRGYHLWAAYGLWDKSSFSSIVQKFLQSKDAPQKLMNFRNSWQGLTWEVTVSEMKDAYLRMCVGEYYQGATPDGPWLITAGVDVQSRNELTYQYYVLRAWGAAGESWLVKAGISESWETLKSILFDSVYVDKSGRRLPLAMVVIDSGYRPDEVYEFCRLTGCAAYKGYTNAQRHLSMKTIETAPGSGQTIPFAVANPNHYKTMLHRLIRDKNWHLPQGLDEEYFSHMVAEQQISETEKRSGRMRVNWRLVSEGKPNHLFDAEVLTLIGAEIIQAGTMTDRPAEPEEKPKKKTKRRVTRVVERVFS